MASKCLLLVTTACANPAAQEFVPKCLVEQCSDEAQALGGDAYAKELGQCLVDDFGPCASDAWECLGDATCQQALQCLPKVFDTCKDSIWEMMTEPDERSKLMCMLSCEKDGKLDPICIATQCGAAAVQCLGDKTCREAAICVPHVLLGCSGEAFACVFGSDEVCQKNLKCLGNGIASCAAPAANILTDTKIADFVSCAGRKCPHPYVPEDREVSSNVLVPLDSVGAPTNTAEQLLCMASNCGSTALQILVDQDSKDLLSCISQRDLPDVCPAVWNCLADEPCRQALTCWSKPFDNCSSDVWHALTDADERQRIESSVQCIKGCEQKHHENFVEATLCVMSECGEAVLSCSKDETCRSAVMCMPDVVGECVMPQLEAYIDQELVSNATKCVGRGLEYCGAAAVEMLRNDDVAEAVKCNAQCTITPKVAVV